MSMDNSFGIDIIPENDQQRVEVLKRYKILDTPPEKAFDNVAKLATQIFNVPIALVSLVDTEKVFFKANIGMGNTKSTSRGISLCALSILEQKITLFEDASEVPLLANNPVVADGLRFYAGAPLITHDGFGIGTICIVDKKPRSFSKQEEEILKGLAAIVMDEIELRLSAIQQYEKEQASKALLIESEYKARYMISEAPVAIGVLTGRELIVETANDKLLEVWGKDKSVIGKHLYLALPELEGQPFLDILDQVYTSGIPYYGSEARVFLKRHGILEEAYFNFVYHPLKNEAGITLNIMVVANEITDQINSRKRIENSEYRLSSLVMAAPMGMTILRGLDFIVETANQPMLDIWNRTREQVIGKHLIDIFPELINQPFPEMLAEVFKTGQALSIPEIEADISTPEGNKKYQVNFKYAPLFDPDGNVEAILATVIDITDIVKARKQLQQSESDQQALNEELTSTVEELAAINEEMAATNEELITTNEELAMTHLKMEKIVSQLAESESRFRGVFEKAPLGMALLQGEGFSIEFANDHMLKFWGKQHDIIGMPHSEALPELKGQPFFALLRNVYSSGIPYKGHETKAVTIKDGKRNEGYYNFVYEPLRDDNGVINSILIISDEVTEKVIRNRQAHRTQEMLNTAIESAQLGTWFIGVETREFIPSVRLKTLLGFQPDDTITYEQAVQQITPEYRGNVTQAIRRAVQLGERYDLEFPITTVDEHKSRWLRATGNLFQIEAGSPSYFSGVIMDITEAKQNEQRKNDFIAMVSHELKTPLTSLKAYLQLLTVRAKKHEDTFGANALEKGNIQVTKMTAMINGFLNISRLEAGKIHLEKQLFCMNDLMQEIVEEVETTTPTHQIKLFSCEPISVEADRDKIGQVINNFLSNAVKYSPKGRNIEVACQQLNGMLQVSIKDEGMGIRPEDIDRLFERFYRVDSQHTQHISGFGIGLYLCAEIINRHQGNIWVESELEKGSTFYFTLPMATA